MWRPVDLDENSCIGIRVKWMGAVGSSGILLPMVCIISGVTKEEMPDDAFMVLEINSLCHNSQMSDCDDRPGYVCFLRKDASADRFFAWYYDSIVLPIIERVRQRHGLPKQEEAVLYLDSDSPNLKHLTSQLMMAKNVEEYNVVISKIGAKVTECWQVKDRMPAHKIMKVVAASTTLLNQTSPLKTLVENGLSKLKFCNRLILPKRKYDAIVDVVSTSPEVYAAAYTDSKHIKKYWIECGYLDGGSYSCPDVTRIMSSSKVHWDPSLREQFYGALPTLLREAFSTDDIRGITEDSFDKIGVPLDTDCNGNEYVLSRCSIITCRSTVISRKELLAGFREKTEELINKQQTVQIERIAQGTRLLEDNRKCEKLLLEVWKKPEGTELSTLVNPPLSIFDSTKVRADLLQAFVSARKLENACTRMIFANKGTVKKVDAGEKCNKTKGPFLIEIAKEVFSSPVIARVPEPSPFVVPTILVPSPSVVKFGRFQQFGERALSGEWCQEVHKHIKSVNMNGIESPENMDSFNDHATHLAKLIHARLPAYLHSRLPKEKGNLQLGQHWVWDSF
jgi:hypothetical protein